MTNQKNHYLHIICYVVFFILLFLINYNELFSLKIANASPMLLVPAVITVSFYYGEWRGFFAGLISGIFIDGVASNVTGFNTILLMLIGLISGLVITHLFNRNIYSACVLSLAASVIYFGAKWLIEYLFIGSADAANYLLFYAAPSAVYTALFIIPFYYVGILINKIKYPQ